MSIYLIWLYGADYSHRNRPEMYGKRSLLGASTRRKNAEAFAEQKRSTMGGIDTENHEIRIETVANL